MRKRHHQQGHLRACEQIRPQGHRSGVGSALGKAKAAEIRGRRMLGLALSVAATKEKLMMRKTVPRPFWLYCLLRWISRFITAEGTESERFDQWAAHRAVKLHCGPKARWAADGCRRPRPPSGGGADSARGGSRWNTAQQLLWRIPLGCCAEARQLLQHSTPKGSASVPLPPACRHTQQKRGGAAHPRIAGGLCLCPAVRPGSRHAAGAPRR